MIFRGQDPEKHAASRRRFYEWKRQRLQCYRCDERAAPGKRMCERHLVVTIRCGECDKPGHNVKRCPQLGRHVCECGRPSQKKLRACNSCRYRQARRNA